MLICLLACYLVWHLRKAWAPLAFTDETPPQRDNLVAPAQRSAAADTKAARKRTPDGTVLRSFRGLLDHLATLTRDRIRYHHTTIEVDKLTDPTPDQAPRLRPDQQPDPSHHRRVATTATYQNTTNPQVNTGICLLQPS